MSNDIETLIDGIRHFAERQGGDHPMPFETALIYSAILQAEATALTAVQLARIADVLESKEIAVDVGAALA
jgi:hypothetical protein